jgi:hypothetical protein
MKNFILSLLLLAALAACGEGRRTELPVLDLEAAMNSGRGLSDAFTLNDLFDDVDIIPIETRPDALIGSAELLHIGKQHFYLRHDAKLSRVDRNGKIVNTISRQGRGPGEYLEMSVVDVNENASTIRVFDRPGDKYITYDMEGGFIDEGSLSGKGVGLPRFIGDDHMVMFGSGSSAYRLFIADRDMNIRQGLFPMDITLTEMERFALTQLVVIGSDGNAALVNFTTADTLYRMEESRIKPEAILHRGQYRRPELPIIQFVTPETQYFISTRVNSSGGYYFIDHLAPLPIAEIWNKSTGELVARTDRRADPDKYGFRFTLAPDVETRVLRFHFGDDAIGFIVDAVHVVGAVDGVGEEDNPVIFVAKFIR